MSRVVEERLGHGSGADWAAWLPGTCQVGRLVRRPGGPSTSNVEVDQTRGRVGRGGRDGQSHKEEDREGGS